MTYNSPIMNSINDRVSNRCSDQGSRWPSVQAGPSPPVDVFVVLDHVFRRLRDAAGAGFRGEFLLLSGGVHLWRPGGRSVRVWSVPSTAAGPVTGGPPPPPGLDPTRPHRDQYTDSMSPGTGFTASESPPSHSIPCQSG